jgi:hypothetical protein
MNGKNALAPTRKYWRHVVFITQNKTQNKDTTTARIRRLHTTIMGTSYAKPTTEMPLDLVKASVSERDAGSTDTQVVLEIALDDLLTRYTFNFSKPLPDVLDFWKSVVLAIK